MINYHVEFGGKTFELICNAFDIEADIELMRAAYKPEYFVPFLDMDENWLDETQYNENIDTLKSEFHKLLNMETAEELVAKAPKKKNGYFHIGRVLYLYGGDNTEFVQEWHNTWVYPALKVKAVNDSVLELFLSKEVDTPG